MGAGNQTLLGEQYELLDLSGLSSFLSMCPSHMGEIANCFLSYCKCIVTVVFSSGQRSFSRPTSFKIS